MRFLNKVFYGLIFLCLSVPAQAFDLSTNNDFPPRNAYINREELAFEDLAPRSQAFVPDSSGRPQALKDFQLLFHGKQDKATARISVVVPHKKYTLWERLKEFRTGIPIVIMLSGTMTAHGFMTNAHGFVEEAPLLRNDILKWWGSSKRYYRFLEPEEIEQGLTTVHAEFDNTDFYYNSVHEIHWSLLKEKIKTYKKSDIERVFIHPSYLQAEKKGRWHFGTINNAYDLAVIKLKPKSIPEGIPLSSVSQKPQTGSISVDIHQYPNGHPLQKKASEQADFETKTHQVLTLGGSSGASLRNDRGQIVGIHAWGGRGSHNGFIPINDDMIQRINKKVYKNKEGA